MPISQESWKMCPVLGVRDVGAASDAFENRLGFSVATELEGVYAIARRGGAEIHLQIRRRLLWTGPREGIENDVYIRVDDVDAVHADLVRRGAEILRAPADQEYGMRDFIVAAPEGYRLSFGAPLAR